MAIELYIGAAIEVESERLLLQNLIELVDGASQNAVVLANITLGARQIDFVVATEDLTLVIEAKGYTRPVRAPRNGSWEVRVASGAWKATGNAYVQARDCALFLRDSLRAFDRNCVPGYPAAAVVFVPGVPNESEFLESDFKVSLIGLSDLPMLLSKKQNCGWTLTQWRAFAEHHRLTKLSSVTAACNQSLLAAEELLKGYKELFRQTYCEQCARLVPVPCRDSHGECSSEAVIAQIVEECRDVLILGPSGCSKSLVAMRAAIEFCEHRGLAMVLAASEFRGNLKELLQRESSLLGVGSAGMLFAAARRLNQPILLVLDGYNECPREYRGGLTRSVAAIARMYEASVLVTSQTGLDKGNLLCLQNCVFDAPTDELKIAIANSSSGGQLNPEIVLLATAVVSGLEASLVGELGRERPLSDSRFALFDAFARKRLGESAREGIEFLVQIASWLCQRVSFSISVRDLDRLAASHGASSQVVTELLQCGLLEARGDRAVFPHEMFLNTFAAEAILRESSGNAVAIIDALSDPRHANRREFLVGTIDDDLLLEQVLNGIIHVDTAVSCLRGTCGRRAKEWAESHCRNLLQRASSETKKLRFKLSADGWDGVSFDDTSLTPWTALDCAFLGAFREMLVEGRYILEVLNSIQLMDERLIDQHRRLLDEARKRKTPLRSALFANAYVFGGRNDSPAITKICTLGGGGRRLEGSPALSQQIAEGLKREDLTPGQIYLLLSLAQYVSDAGAFLAPSIVKLIRRNWRSAPYHLQLEILQAAERCRCAVEEEREALIAELNDLETNNIAISGTLIDALQILGALDDGEREHEQEVREAVATVLANPDLPIFHTRAHHLYYRQFDHPYSGAYSEIIHGLSDAERKLLLAMAAQGADDSTLFMSCLISDLAAYEDSADGAFLVRFIKIPDADCGGSQEAMEVFVTAHLALARLRYPLPVRENLDDPSAAAIAACGEILYWSNRSDLSDAEQHASCTNALAILMQEDAGFVLDAIRVCDQWFLQDSTRRDNQIRRHVTDCFPDHVAEVCRQALQSQTEQVRYFHRHFDYDKFKPLEFAIQVLSQYGNSADLMILRRYVSHPELGSVAISAIKSVEERFVLS